MKTIIQVVQHLRPGGIETLSLDLLSFCQANEHMLIISLEGDINSALKAWPRLSAYKNQLIFMDKSTGLQPKLVYQLVKLFKSLNADTIHSHHIGPLLYAGLAARLAGIKHFIHTEHDAWHLNDNKRKTIQKFAISALQPTLVADAETVANCMKAKLGNQHNITIINNGIDTEYFIPGNKQSARDILSLPQDVQLIGCSGRLEKVKGQRILINALIDLPNNVHVALAGIGTMEADLRQQAEKLGLSSRVHFLGRLDNMPVFYQSLDVFCLPSLNEGFPLSPLEAQACNVQTLVTDVGGAKETLCPDSGKWVCANDFMQMALALQSILLSPCVASPRHYVKQHGDVRIMAKAYSNLRQ
jgi:glycosyltransferase involved in cell wall biosynthesis